MLDLPPIPSAPAGWSLAITDGLTLDDLVRVAPTSLHVLGGHGVDAERGGGWTLADVARRHELALEALLEELREAASDDDAWRGGRGGLGGARVH